MRWFVTLLIATTSSVRAVHHATTVVECGIVVAGGSAASLAAAITAATAAPTVTVCLTDPTDWLGGQMTASAVSAMDFGANGNPRFQSKSFRDLMSALGAPTNPGACWVSSMCYEPLNLLHSYVYPTVAKLPNLRVFNRTVITATEPCVDSPRTICSLTAVQRVPKENGTAAGWSKLLSQAVADWYSPLPSIDFDKTTLQLKGDVFIEATEFGDVLVTGASTSLKLPLSQGIEEPQELSRTTNDQCGQAATLTFYMGIRNRSSAPPDVPVPAGGTAGNFPFDIPGDGHGASKPWTWGQVWTYRRAKVGPNTPHNDMGVPGVGDVTQQNWGGGNDLDNAYLFQPLSDAIATAKRGEWIGGLNLTAMSMLEQRAYGWYHYYEQHWKNQSKSAQLPDAEVFLDRMTAGTLTGLAKMPYVRDTRRSVGLDGYRLPYTNISNVESDDGYGVHFVDTVAIGSYNHDTHGLSSCKLPAYLHAPKSKPYYIPMRALTNDGADNLLVCGKTMATTFSANSATRLHPDEWSTGVAAGAAATLLSGVVGDDGDGVGVGVGVGYQSDTTQHHTTRQHYNTTRDLIAGVGLAALLQVLNSSDIQQPLNWTGDIPPVPGPHKPVGYGCGSGDRCYGVANTQTPFRLTNSSSCDSDCPVLASDEWLANENFWVFNSSSLTIESKNPTVLKKSEIESLDLPPSQTRSVPRGFTCKLNAMASAAVHGYYMCTAL